MTDTEKIKLISKMIGVSYEFIPGDGLAQYWEATIQAIQCVADFGREDNDNG